eukprot:751942-Hanusia_phi.AAC.2
MNNCLAMRRSFHSEKRVSVRMQSFSSDAKPCISRLLSFSRQVNALHESRHPSIDQRCKIDRMEAIGRQIPFPPECHNILNDPGVSWACERLTRFNTVCDRGAEAGKRNSGWGTGEDQAPCQRMRGGGACIVAPQTLVWIIDLLYRPKKIFVQKYLDYTHLFFKMPSRVRLGDGNLGMAWMMHVYPLNRTICPVNRRSFKNGMTIIPSKNLRKSVPCS